MCRPFYMPRELSAVIITAVYIPPDANVSETIQLQAHPEGAFIVAGDFNQACLKSVLPKFVQYVQCSSIFQFKASKPSTLALLRVVC